MPGHDVVIVGAGIAGLAAACDLAAAGRRVLLLEARDRLGGRIHTVTDPEIDYPIELGAEFVHGKPAELVSLLREHRLAVVPVPERHERGPGHRDTPLVDMRETLAHLLRPPLEDEPVAELLRRRRDAAGDPGAVDAVRQYLQGFHAADLERLGTASLAENERASDEDGDVIGRVREGYGELVRRMTRRLDAGRVEIRLEHVIERVGWHPGAVQLLVRHADGAVEVRATQAILTLPLGVLKPPMGAGGTVAIEPPPPGWQAKLGALHMGAAHRVVLGFDERWWASDGGEGRSFVHGTREAFPIWWTALPSPAPVLTGWTGGPRAESLAGRGAGAMLETAVASLASVFGRGEAEIQSHLRFCHAHDWSADPFARGAYSYGGVGAIEARAALARPVAGTLALAGEAVALGGRNGTVHGAIASGRAAARALLG